MKKQVFKKHFPTFYGWAVLLSQRLRKHSVTGKPRLVLNADTMTLVNLEGYSVINKQYGDTGKGVKGYRITVHYQGGKGLAVLAVYSEEEHANECLKHLIHYIMTGEDTGEEGESKDVFVVRSVVKESQIIVPDSENAGNLVEFKK
jgi:hypothetical protein